jgi:hypothetical protein
VLPPKPQGPKAKRASKGRAEGWALDARLNWLLQAAGWRQGDIKRFASFLVFFERSVFLFFGGGGLTQDKQKTEQPEQRKSQKQVHVVGTISRKTSDSTDKFNCRSFSD